MVIRLGMLGYNPGNGHPFSFSAIVNGYEDASMRAAGWGVIADYLAPHELPSKLAGVARVTSVWCPTAEVSAALARTCAIDQVVTEPQAMFGGVDAVIVARDDWETHLPLALPFLEQGVPVFVDKPLTLDPAELSVFLLYLERGQLASWSGLRFAPELRSLPPSTGTASIRGIGVGTWDRYAVHLLEPLLALAGEVPLSGEPLPCDHEAVAFRMPSGRLLQVDVLGAGAQTGFHLEAFSADNFDHIEFRDRFTAFEGGLVAFIEQVQSGQPSVSPQATVTTIRALIAGRRALRESRRVELSEVAA
jgi:predicted dehydrogenase